MTEKITYRFGTSEGRHGIVRTIPLRGRVDATRDRMIEIRNARVEGPDHLDVATSHGNTVLRIGNPNVTMSGVRTYIIDYDVPRALVPRGTAEALSWNAVGTEWRVPVHAVTVALSAPVRIAAAMCLRGTGGLRSGGRGRVAVPAAQGPADRPARRGFLAARCEPRAGRRAPA